MPWIHLKTTGGELPVWEVKPKGKEKVGGVIMFHEAFRITAHIMRMAAWLGNEGYHVLVPDMLFRQAEPMQPLPVNKVGLDEARVLIGKTKESDLLADMQACVDDLHAKGCTKVGTIGYCYGGSLAYFAGTHLDVQAVDSYYGGQLWELAAKGQPKCATQVHLAVHDQYIPLDKTKESFQAHHSAAKVFVYEADHGFNRDDGVTYDPIASSLARARTLELFGKNLT